MGYNNSFPLSCKTKPGQPPPLPLICSSRCPLPWQQTKRTEAAVLPLTAVTTSSLRRTFPSSPYRWPPPKPRQPQLFFIFCNRPQAAPQAPPSGLAARSQLNSDTPLVLPPPEADERKKLSQPPNSSLAEGK